MKMKDQVVRDILFCGIAHDDTRQRLLNEDKLNLGLVIKPS